MDALFFLPTKSWKNHPQKLLRVTQIHFFFLTAWAAQTAQTEKMWPIDQLYIELGSRQLMILSFITQRTKKIIVVFHSRWETTGIDALYTQLWLLWVILHEHEPTTAMLLPPRRPKLSNTLVSLSGCLQTKSNKINQCR